MAMKTFTFYESYPEIKVRVSSSGDFLVKVLCENSKDIHAKILGEIQKLNLSVTGSYQLPFGTSLVDITVVAKLEKELEMELEDFVESLRVAIQQLR
ncbi:hypothetical protein ACHQM5_014317 [Ranunculus cassubicifolius]